jgi:hypothetical protein
MAKRPIRSDADHAAALENQRPSEKVEPAGASTVDRIELRFGSPVHGWLEVTLAGAGGKSSLDASDVPFDSLRILADVVRNVVDGRNGEVPWSLEPAERTWRFAVDGDEVRVSVSEDSRPDRWLARGTVMEVGLVVWRALRRLEADPAWQSADRDVVWSHPFPHREVAALGEELGRTRSRTK